MIRKNKTLFILFLITGLLLSQAAATRPADSASSSASAYSDVIPAKTGISKDEATKIIKGFPFAQGLKISSIHIENSKEFNQPVWKMDYYSPGYPTEWGIRISANTGELLSYYCYQMAKDKKNIVNITQKKAKELADKFLSDYVKPDAKNLEYSGSNSYPISGGIAGLPIHQFTYALKINGIKTSNIQYTLSVNAVDGKILNFSSPSYGYIKETKYPSPAGVRNPTELMDKYLSSLGMQLQYRITYNDNYKPTVRLNYIPTSTGWLDAKTRTAVDTDYITYYGNASLLANKYAPINPEVQVENKKITKEDASKILKKAKAYVESLCGFKFNDVPNMTRPPKNNEFFSGYSLETDEKCFNLSISLNLSTGNITEMDFTYLIYGNKANEEEISENVSYPDAKKISDGLIKNIFAKQYGVFSDNNQPPSASNEAAKERKNHIFQYTRYENGVPTDDLISVCVDKETGKPGSVSMKWHDMDFPKAADIISPQAAKEAFSKYAQFSVEYYIPHNNRTEDPDKPEEAIIVFKPEDSAMNTFVDAATGKIVDYNGEIIQIPNVPVNHWAADNIDMLEAQGVSINSLSNCDEKLARQDAVKMLSQVLHIMGIQYINPESLKKDSFSDVSNESEYYKYVETAVQSGIIKATGKKFNGAQKITKGEYIVMLLDTLGYKEIARNINPASESFINAYISKCKSLSLLPVKPGNKFNYKDTLTFAEAAYSLQKALKFFK